MRNLRPNLIYLTFFVQYIMHIIYAYRLVAVGSKCNVEKYPAINFVGGGVLF